MKDSSLLNIGNIQRKNIKKNKVLENNFCNINNCFNILIILSLLLNIYFIFIFYSRQRMYLINQKKLTDKNYIKSIYLDNLQFESYDLKIFEQIKNKIEGYVELALNEQKFLNGIIRKFIPKKIVEIGVAYGGSSAIILNSIKDIKDSKLYSIDKSLYCYRMPKKKSGFIVEEKFPELMDKWTLYKGKITSEVIENIGNDIDLVFIDTKHYVPGEMLDWLQVLPFLKEEAIVILHDTFLMYNKGKIIKKKKNFSNNQILTYIRGELILPNYGSELFSHNIGAIKLCKAQNKFYRHYFMALGTQWEFMPDNADLKLIRKFFMKYYGNKYVEIYDDAVEKNKIHLNK